MSKVSGLFQDLTTVKKARNGRLASWDQRGKNQDYWEIPAKESIVLGEVEGPGCITHIWMTSSCRKVKWVGSKYFGSGIKCIGGSGHGDSPCIRRDMGRL